MAKTSSEQQPITLETYLAVIGANNRVTFVATRFFPDPSFALTIDEWNAVFVEKQLNN